MTRYIVGCCTETVAGIEVDGDRVTIHPPDGEKLRRLKPPPRTPTEGKERLGEQVMKYQYAVQDQIHSWITTEYTPGHHVSEILWPDHSSWVMRCTGCGEMARVRDLPKLARLLTEGNWSVTGGVVLLGVLHAAMTDSGI